MYEDTATQAEIRALVSEVAAAEIAPNADRWNADHHAPIDCLRQLGALGVLGTIVPEPYGGAGLGASELAVVVEELARYDAGIAVAVAVHAGLMPVALANWGSDGQRERFLPGVARGDTLAAYCLTEPECGSDVSALRTTARATDGGWTLHGSKTWITNGGFAEVMVVFARDDRDYQVGAVLASVSSADARFRSSDCTRRRPAS